VSLSRRIWADRYLGDVGETLTTVVPDTADRGAVLGDSDDATYHFATGADVGGAFPYTGTIGLGDVDIPTGSRIEYVQLGARVQAFGGVAPTLTASVSYREGDSPVWTEDIDILPDGAKHDWHGQKRSRNTATGADWTESDIQTFVASMQLYDLQANPSGDSYLFELFMDAWYRRPGTVTIGAVADNTLTPKISWTPIAPDNTKNPQVAYRVRLFAYAETRVPNFDPWSSPCTWDSGIKGSGSARAVTIPRFKLENDIRFYAYVFVAQPWGGTQGSLWWNPVPKAATWVVNVPLLPAPPAVTVTSDDKNSRVRIHAAAGYNPRTGEDAVLVAQRLAPGGTWTDVAYSAPAVAGATFFDYEAERGVDISYRIRAETDTNHSAWGPVHRTDLSIDGVWLKDRLAPERSRKIRMLSPFKVKQVEAQTVQDVLGDALPVVVSDGLKGWKCDAMTVQTEDAEEYADLLALLGGLRPLLLQDALGRQWWARFGGDWTPDWLRAVPEAGSRFPVRHLNRFNLSWVETEPPNVPE
jgi:hypothetical protein